MPKQDYFAVLFLSKEGNIHTKVYADTSGCGKLNYGMIGPFGMSDRILTLTNSTKINGEAYIFLGYFNNIWQVLSATGFKSSLYYNVTDIYNILNKSNKIYDNGATLHLFTQTYLGE